MKQADKPEGHISSVKDNDADVSSVSQPVKYQFSVFHYLTDTGGTTEHWFDTITQLTSFQLILTGQQAAVLGP